MGNERKHSFSDEGHLCPQQNLHRTQSQEIFFLPWPTILQLVSRKERLFSSPQHWLFLQVFIKLTLYLKRLTKKLHYFPQPSSMMILPKAFAFVLLFSGSTEAQSTLSADDPPLFFNADPVDIDIPVSNLVIKAEPGELEEECNICGGGSLPEVNQRLQLGASTIEDCFALTTITEDEKLTFCGLIEFFDGFDCGSAQSNPALFPDFCPGFQNTLGVACSCSSVVLAPPAPASESVPVPGTVPDSNEQEDTDEPGGFLAGFRR